MTLKKEVKQRKTRNTAQTSQRKWPSEQVDVTVTLKGVLVVMPECPWFSSAPSTNSHFIAYSDSNFRLRLSNVFQYQNLLYFDAPLHMRFYHKKGLILSLLSVFYKRQSLVTHHVCVYVCGPVRSFQPTDLPILM